MRIIFLIIGLVAASAFVYKWRYRILNMVLAIGFLRKFAVQLSMSSPSIRSLFKSKMSQTNTNV